MIRSGTDDCWPRADVEQVCLNTLRSSGRLRPCRSKEQKAKSEEVRILPIAPNLVFPENASGGRDRGNDPSNV